MSLTVISFANDAASYTVYTLSTMYQEVNIHDVCPLTPWCPRPHLAFPSLPCSSTDCCHPLSLLGIRAWVWGLSGQHRCPELFLGRTWRWLSLSQVGNTTAGDLAGASFSLSSIQCLVPPSQKLQYSWGSPTHCGWWGDAWLSTGHSVLGQRLAWREPGSQWVL